MRDLDRLILAIVAAYGLALAVPWWRARLRGGWADAATWLSGILITACPLLIGPDRPGLRAASAFLSTDLLFRLVDCWGLLHRRGPAPPFRDYGRSLVPFPALLVVYADRARRRTSPAPIGREVAKVVGGAAIVGLCCLILAILARVPAVRSSFALDHAAKFALFAMTIEALARSLNGLERLAGFDVRPIVDESYRSRTVAEFWSRYDNRVHRWFLHNVFRPSGGRRHPARGIWLVYLASGLLHELAFGIATSRFDGSQLAFFLLQAPATLASGRVERMARRGGVAGKVIAHGLTIGFMLVTSVLIFRGVERVFPFFYASEPPWP